MSLSRLLSPPEPRVERKPSTLLPRLPVDTEAMPIEALLPSLTFEPSAKFAPPPVMSKSAVPAFVLAADASVNSTSIWLLRNVTSRPLTLALAPLTATVASRPLAWLADGVKLVPETTSKVT